MAHSRLTGRRHRPRPGAPDEHRLGTDGDHLDDVEPGAYAAVDEHLHLTADRVDHVRKRADGRRHRVELAAAVV